MSVDPLRGSSAAVGGGDVYRPALVFVQPPKRSRRAMRQHRPRSTSQHRGHVSLLSGRCQVSYGVDPLMYPVQPSARHPSVDGAPVDAKAFQLIQRHEPMLAKCDLSDLPIPTGA
jgi:hypothetical protein